MHSSRSFALAIVIGLFIPSAAHADRHVAYEQAHVTLRDAKANLKRPAAFDRKVKWDEKKVSDEIDAAEAELTKAGIEWPIGNKASDRPNLSHDDEWDAHLKFAEHLLAATRKSITKTEGDWEADGLRKRVFQHLDAATAEIETGLVALAPPPLPPAVVPKTAEGGRPLEAEVVPPGKGWFCYHPDGDRRPEECHREQAECRKQHERRKAFATTDCAPMVPWCMTGGDDPKVGHRLICYKDRTTCMAVRDEATSEKQEENNIFWSSGCAELP